MSTELDKARAASADVEHERKARLGPSGVATPGYGLTPKARFVLGAHLKEALAEVDRLTAALAEAEATLANERGEGEPPSEGWEPCDTSPGRWEHRSRQWCCYRIKSKDYIVIVRGSLSGEIAREKTARAAMRAAAGVKS